MEGYKPSLERQQVGQIIEVGDGIARISGLPTTSVNELLEFEGGTLGLALKPRRGVDRPPSFLGEMGHIEDGQAVSATGRILSVPVGDGLLGRVVDALGQPLDGNGRHQHQREPAPGDPGPGVVDRQPCEGALQTGIKSIDAMTRWAGPARADHRATARRARPRRRRHDHQPDGPGGEGHLRRHRPKNSTVAEVVAALEEYGAMEYTVVVNAPSGEPAPFKYLAPYTGGPWVPTGWRRATPPSSSTTTCPSRPRLPQLSLLLRGPRAARHTPATSSTSTAACSSALGQALRRAGAAGRSHRSAHHRDQRGRRLRLHPHQRDLDHRRPESTCRPTCSAPACGRRSTWASRSPVGAAAPRSRP